MNILIIKLAFHFLLLLLPCDLHSDVLLQADSGREEVLEQECAAAGGERAPAPGQHDSVQGPQQKVCECD